MSLLNKGQYAQALPIAEKWCAKDAGDISAIVALGEVLEARCDAARALRVYGSIIDLFPSRADLRRFAGERLEPNLPSGGELYADVTTGYGPECFNIPNKPRAFPYKLEAHYFSRGPMGYGMGKLQIIAHDGNGGLKFVEQPFVVMNDHAYVDLGVLNAPL